MRQSLPQRFAVLVAAMVILLSVFAWRYWQYRAPIRFVGESTVTPVAAGEITEVTWQFIVTRDDCSRPSVNLHHRDARDLARSVDLYRFRPIKLHARPEPYSLTYQIATDPDAVVGEGSLGLDMTYDCSGAAIAVIAPVLPFRILPPDL